MSTLKCPNPSCPYQFDPAQLPQGVVLSCPRCATQFTLGAPAVAPPPALEFPTAPAEPGPAYRGGAGPSRLQTFFLAVFAACVLAGVGLAIYFRAFHKTPEKARGSGEERRDINLGYQPPPAPWEQDDTLRAKLGSPMFVAFKRTNPDGYILFGAKDYKTRSARPAEVLEGLNAPLARLFTNIPEAHEFVKGHPWLGEEAIYFGFRGTTRQGGQNVVGECHAVANRGVAYWAICWAGENDYSGLVPEIDAVRASFKLLNYRDDWAEKKPAVVPHRGDKLDYTISDPDGIWKDADRKPETEDPKADKFLVAKVTHEGFDRPDEAELLVLILDDGGDPLEALRKHVESEANKDKEGRGTNTFTALDGPPEGEPVRNTTPANAKVLRLRSKNDRSRDHSWLYALAAIRVGEKVVGVVARCGWEQRTEFDGKFVQIVGSLRPGR